jgi:hypothetical protein
MKINSINISPKITNELNNRLSLNPNQVIKAQVVKVDGNHILLQYGSHLVKAKTNLALKPGTRLNLVVELAKDGLINLKIINKNINNGSDNTISLTPSLKPKQELETVSKELIKFNMPVSSEVITELNKFLNKNKLSTDIGQLVVWLKSVGIKVESEQDMLALQALAKFFQGSLSSDEEPRYFKLLNETENQYMGGLNICGWPLGKHHVYLIKQGSKSEPFLPESCKLALKVDSLALKELWFVIELTNNGMTANIICTNELYRDILEKEIVNLKTVLEGTGYLVKELAIEVDKGKVTVFDLLYQQEITNINVQI